MAKTILCIDTDRETISHLTKRGFHVVEGQLGYTNGIRHLTTPPHDADLIVFNLEQPVFMDYGTLPPSPIRPEHITNEMMVPSGTSTKRLEFKQRLISPSQITTTQTSFNHDDVIKAVSDAGVPLLIFLNQTWTPRTKQIPQICDHLEWKIEVTAAQSLNVQNPLADLLPELGSTLQFRANMLTRITSGPIRFFGPYGETQPIVINKVGDVFGQVSFIGCGSIWILPDTHANNEVIALFADRLASVCDIQRRPPGTPADTAPPEGGAISDTTSSDVRNTLTLIISGFHRFATQLAQPRKGIAQPIEIRSEDYAQYFFEAILRLFIDDVRAEERTPSLAGSSTQIDFYLSDDSIGVELKVASNTHRDKAIGDELLLDVIHFREHTGCTELWCFIYDPQHKLRNPAGLVKDIEKQSTEAFRVRVLVSP